MKLKCSSIYIPKTKSNLLGESCLSLKANISIRSIGFLLGITLGRKSLIPILNLLKPDTLTNYYCNDRKSKAIFSPANGAYNRTHIKTWMYKALYFGGRHSIVSAIRDKTKWGFGFHVMEKVKKIEAALKYSQHRLKSKNLLAMLTKSNRFIEDSNFKTLNPIYDITSIEIENTIKDIVRQ